MPFVDMKDMLHHAYNNGYAVGAFDLVSLDFLKGIISAAERCRAPVVLSLAESHFDYFDFELIMPAVEAAAQRATVPVAVHLDHGASLDSAVRAINLGCNGVMVDASHEPMPGNKCRTSNQHESHAIKCPTSQATTVMSKHLADKPPHTASQWHYPMDQQWSTDNAFMKIHIRHRDTA